MTNSLSRLESKLRDLGAEVLLDLRRGIEKESLRIRPDGTLALTAHPAALGSPLTSPRITTDFSEAQLELITDVHDRLEGCLDELTATHQVVYRHIADELLWCNSMPCKLPVEEAIPLGRYGSSNIGRSKTVYRQGLAHRYGRRMQTICGIHYNFSLADAAWPMLMRADGAAGSAADYRNAAYFSLIRNFRRHSWLLIFLFGASPAVCSSFVEGREHALQEFARGTMYLPYGTSLRMGPLGYQSDAQSTLAVSYNSLESYVASLKGAVTQPYPPYEAIGVREGDDYRQLATTLLQIENEFYGTIRPKRRIRRGERPLRALIDRGVEYVEVRCMDLDSFCPIGISADTIRFLDVFLLHCLLADSAPDTPDEMVALSRNQRLVAGRGRDPALRLNRSGQEVSVEAWGTELVAQCAPIASKLDEVHATKAYTDALASASAALHDPSLTPSARILSEMERRYGKSFLGFTLAQSQRHRGTLLDRPLAAALEARYAAMAAESLAQQRAIEAADDVPFETYRQRYLAQVSG